MRFFCVKECFLFSLSRREAAQERRQKDPVSDGEGEETKIVF